MKMISIAFNMDNLTPANAELRAGLDLEGFLLLGILWDLGFTTEGGDSATELAVGVWTSANLLSEENGLPISFGVSGDFRKMRTLSTYLDTNDLVKSGSGYKIGAVLSKNFPINETSSLDLALDGFYQFDTYTLEARAGSGITFETQISPYTNYTYGITATYVNVLAEDIAISYRLAIHLDKNLRFIYGPGFGFNAR
ncbi:MAG: hypothetical protein HN368_20335 [Spirochaetales bacterium]|nr:hypothetical protein [Spirochaetales bacterium]